MRIDPSWRVILASLSLAAPAFVQAQAGSACVVDQADRPVASARAIGAGGRLLGVSDERGRLPAVDPGLVLRIERLGFLPHEVSPTTTHDPARCLVLRAALPMLPGVIVADRRTPALGQSITRETAQRAPALAEPDAFRSLPLAAAVTQVNDLRGTVHLAGGATDETGITLDGHPLQWPFHAASALSAFNVAALDRVDVSIHSLRADQGDVLAGMIDLIPRGATARPSVTLDVSLLSTTLTAVAPAPRDVDVLVSGRITYLGGVVARINRAPATSVPTYRDFLVRAARGDSSGWSGSLLGYATRDDRRSGDADGAGSTWGELMTGARIGFTTPKWQLQARASASRSRLDEESGRPSLPRRIDSGAFIPGPGSQHVLLVQDWLSATATATWRGPYGWRAMAGQGVDDRRHMWDWNSSSARTVLAPHAPLIVASTRALRRFATVGELSRELAAGHTMTAGVRATHHLAQWHLAPRVLLQSPISSTTDVAAALERRFQYDAVPEELVTGGQLPPVALLAVPRRADVASLSIAHRFPAARRHTSVRAVLFHREYRQRPQLGDAVVHADDDWPYSSFGRGPGRASGASITGETTLAGAIALQGTYTRQRVVEVASEVTRPAAWDAPHSGTLFGSAPLGARWSASFLAQLHSGTAVTPAEARILIPSLETSPRYSGRLLYGAENGARLPTYYRLDLGVRREWRAADIAWTFSMQAINVMNRRNLLSYDLPLSLSCNPERGACDAPAGERSLPFVPSIGLQGRWGPR